MHFTPAIAALILAVTTEARTFAVLRFNGKALTTGRMDPMVSPGVASGHVHNIQGGNAFKLTMSDDDPLSSTCTNAKIQNDKSNYWTPSLFFQDPQTGVLESVDLFYMNVYYFFENDNDKVHPFPKGLRMFSGNPGARTPPATSDNILDTSQGTPQPIQWTCPRSNTNTRLYPANSNGLNGVGIQDTNNQGAGVGFPDQECDGYASPLRADIHFPSCYDTSKGVRDYKENMKWPANNRCPDGTIRVPHLFFEVYWDTLKFKDRWTKGQGKSPWVLSNGDPTGYSLHADFINGWDQNTLQTIIDTCDAGSSGMDKCPNIPGGLNDDQTCTVPNFVPETVFGTMSKLPGNNPITPWGKDVTAPAPAPAQPSANPPAANPPAAGNDPYAPPVTQPTTTRAAAAVVVKPQATPSTTLQAVTTSRAAPATTKPAAQPQQPNNGGVVVTDYVSETIIVYKTITLPAPGASSAPVAAAAAISGYKYKGCYSDKVSARVLTGITFADVGHHQVTNTKCIAYCSARGFSIAGTEFGGQCFCGNALVGSKKIEASKCAMKCEGDDKETCGGPDALSVFEKAHVKRGRHLHRHAAHARS